MQARPATKPASHKTRAGGPAITTAYAEILDGCPHLDAACYSEGEVGLKNLIEAERKQARNGN